MIRETVSLPPPGPKTLTMVIVTFAHVLLAAAGVFAILKVAFGVAA